MRKKELLLSLGLVAWVVGCGLVLLQGGRINNLERETQESVAEARQARLLAEETEQALQELRAEVTALRSYTAARANEEPLAPFPVFDDNTANEELRAEIDRIARGLTWEGRDERR
jgi:hypothetical protein